MVRGGDRADSKRDEDQAGVPDVSRHLQCKERGDAGDHCDVGGVGGLFDVGAVNQHTKERATEQGGQQGTGGNDADELGGVGDIPRQPADDDTADPEGVDVGNGPKEVETELGGSQGD